MPIVSASSPSDSFDAAYEAVRIAVQHMTPVILLSDGAIANSAEPWRYPQSADLAPITVNFKKALEEDEPKFQPYRRNAFGVRPWAVPGTPGLEHRIGGLEKEDITGNVSYDPDNHEKMIKIREEKVQRVADFIPEQKLDSGNLAEDEVLVLGWGSTYGAIKSAVAELRKDRGLVSHAHLRHMRPFPKNLGGILKRYRKVIVPEMNNGQLVKIIRDQFMVDAVPLNKIKGVPFTKGELVEAIRQHL
jgi:2-oxoglutarate ferredoxin oxidoreductase subunit alpha